ncbi:hypothetical protein ACTFIZ_006509 [Dictyostelium cf. discoideum]
MIKTIILLLINFMLILIVNGDIWNYCEGNINPTFKINKLTLLPDPPLVGKDVTVSLEGSLNEQITSGSSIFNVAFFINGGWRQLPTFHNDICKVLSCPVSAGPFTYSTSIKVPIFTPHGQYKGQLTLTDQSNRNVTCLTFQTYLK